ncbi:MAG: NADH-quinone oxidoreductase subunit NuoE [Phycisphaerales bacterium]|nr:MAG: NADH-quinone oxidoreductase subunit NuoE [Phycisphaerales bacterium]
MARDVVEQVMQDFAGEPQDLIPVLQRIQDVDGYLAADTISRIARWIKMSENEIYGVATFYAQFRFSRPGRHHIKACLGTACHVQGGEQMLDVLQRRLDIKPGDTSEDGEYDLDRVACLGCCALAPVVTIDEKTYGQMSVLKLQRLLDERENRN